MDITPDLSRATNSSAVSISEPARDNAPYSGSSDQSDRHQILSAIYAETQPAKPPATWAFLAESGSVRRLRCAALELAAKLQQKFRLKQLLESHVFVQSEVNNTTLNPIFSSTSNLLFIGNERKAFRDVVSSIGEYSFKDPRGDPLACARCAQAGDQSKQLLLAATDEDMLVMNCLGHRCHWAIGLNDLTGEMVRKMFSPFGPNEPGYKFNLVLVGWHVAALDKRPPRLLEEILNRLAAAQKLYGIDSASRIRVWLPTIQQVNTIKLAVEFRDRKPINEIIAEGLKTATYSPADALSRFAKPPVLDFAAARANLRSVIDRSCDMPRPQEARDALKKLNQAFNKAVMQKFYQAAAASSDPFESALLLASAELAAHWFTTQEILAAAHQVVAMQVPECRSAIDPDMLKDRLHLVNALMKVHQTLLRNKNY